MFRVSFLILLLFSSQSIFPQEQGDFRSQAKSDTIRFWKSLWPDLSWFLFDGVHLFIQHGLVTRVVPRYHTPTSVDEVRVSDYEQLDGIAQSNKILDDDSSYEKTIMRGDLQIRAGSAKVEFQRFLYPGGGAALNLLAGGSDNGIHAYSVCFIPGNGFIYTFKQLKFNGIEVPVKYTFENGTFKELQQPLYFYEQTCRANENISVYSTESTETEIAQVVAGEKLEILGFFPKDQNLILVRTPSNLTGWMRYKVLNPSRGFYEGNLSGLAPTGFGFD